MCESAVVVVVVVVTGLEGESSSLKYCGSAVSSIVMVADWLVGAWRCLLEVSEATNKAGR